MVKIGITGGIGSGKTTACHYFQKLGVPVYQADAAAKELIQNQLKSQIEFLLGEQAFLPDGSYNHQWVAQKVFSDKDVLERLNKIVHPAVKSHFAQWAENQHGVYVLKEAALLLESGSYHDLDAVVVVVAPLALRIERILKRDSHRSKEQVLEIIAKQTNDEEKIAISNYLIHNDLHTNLENEVEKVHHQILSDFKTRSR